MYRHEPCNWKKIRYRKPVSAQNLREAVIVLRSLVPLPHPYKLIRTKMEDAWGSCSFKPDPPRFIIRIAKGITEDQAIDTLMHEWSHARAWLEQTLDHSAYWGVAFSECYQALYEE